MNTHQMADVKKHALQAFLRGLPQLHVQRPGQWVAYQADNQVGFAAQKHMLYQHCIDQGLEREKLVVFCIEPQETEIMLSPVAQD